MVLDVGDRGDVLDERAVPPLGFLQSCLSLPPVGDVPTVVDDPRDAGIVQEVRGHDLEQPRRAVRPIDRQLGGDRRTRVRQCVGEEARDGAPLGLGSPLVAEEMAADDLLRPYAEETLNRGAGVGPDAVGVEDDNDVGRVLDEGAEARLAAAQVVLRPHPRLAGRRLPLGEGDAALERIEPERFGHVVVSAGGDDLVEVLRLGTAGQDQDRAALAARPRAQPPAELDTVHAGQPPVEDRQRHDLVPAAFPGGLGVRKG